MIKRKFSKALLIAASAAILASCATAPASKDTDKTEKIDNATSGKTEKTENNDSSQDLQQDEMFVEEPVVEKVRKEPKPITVQNTANHKETEFKALLETLELKIVSSPSSKKTIYPGQDFSAPYILSATTKDGAAADLDISVSYPMARSNDIISYNTVQLKTDAEGKISFKPEASSIAVKDKITFYPTPVSSSSNIIQDAYAAAVTAPYVVKSNYTKWPGGILFIYDFNENGKPTTNNFSMLQTLRNSGINAGNCPVSDTSFFNKGIKALYDECMNMTMGEIKNSASFLVMGSLKYAEPAVESDDGVTCTLVCDITCVDMKGCNQLYKTTLTETVTDKTKWNAEQKARKALADRACDAIMYSM